jgi:hypothetical protein
MAEDTIAARRVDLLVEVDRSRSGADNAATLAAHDHFLGRCLRTRHWGEERRTRPVAALVAHSPQAMLNLLPGADQARFESRRSGRPRSRQRGVQFAEAHKAPSAACTPTRSRDRRPSS